MGDEPAENGRPRSELGGKIALLVADKLVFGLLILLAGFVLDSVLDRNRAETAFENEVAQVRVEKTAIVWGALDRQQLLTDRLAQEFQRGACRDGTIASYDPRPVERLRRQLAQGNATFRQLLATNRFWLGDELFAPLDDYARRQAELSHVMSVDASRPRTLLNAILNVVADASTGVGLSTGGRLPRTSAELVALRRELEQAGLERSARRLDGFCTKPTGEDARRFSTSLANLKAARQDVVQVVDELIS